MSEFRKLLHHSSHYLTGRVAAIAVGFVSFPLFTQMMSVADYGILNLAQRVGVFLAGVGKLGLQHTLMRQYEERSKEPDGLRALVSTLVLGNLLILLPVLAVYCAVVLALQGWSLSSELTHPLLAVALLGAVRVVQSMAFALLRMEERTKLFNVLDVGNRVLTLAAVVALFLLWSKTPTVFLIGAAAAEGLLLAGTWFFLMRRDLVSWRYFNSPLLRESMVYSVPMLGYELSMVLLGSSDRPLIQYFLGSQDLGYYAAAVSLATYIGDALQSPLNLALFPICVRIFNEQGEQATARFLNRIVVYYAAASVVLIAATSASARDILVFLSGEKYLPAAPLLAPLVAGTMIYLAHTLFSIGLLLRKKPVVMVRVVFFSFLCKLALSLPLLPWLGLWGAVVATVAGYLMLLIWMWKSGRRCLEYRFPPLVAAKLIFGGVVALGVAWWVPPFGPRLLTIVVRSLVCAAVYGGILLAIEKEFRGLAKLIRDRIMERSPTPAK